MVYYYVVRICFRYSTQDQSKLTSPRELSPLTSVVQNSALKFLAVFYNNRLLNKAVVWIALRASTVCLVISLI